MKVHLIKKQAVEDFVAGHADGRRPFENWLSMVKYANWVTPADIQQTFGAADLLGGGHNRVVFNIGGNKYRIICKYHFGNTKVHLFVCWIGTHGEYDYLCCLGEQFTVFEY